MPVLGALAGRQRAAAETRPGRHDACLGHRVHGCRDGQTPSPLTSRLSGAVSSGGRRAQRASAVPPQSSD